MIITSDSWFTCTRDLIHAYVYGLGSLLCGDDVIMADIAVCTYLNKRK